MIGAPRGASYAVPSTPREEASTATTPASVRCNSANLQPRVVVRHTEGRARHYAATPRREASHDKPAGDDPHWDSQPGLPNSRACRRGPTRTPPSKQVAMFRQPHATPTTRRKRVSEPCQSR
ncbi:hypothetical protein COCVIDRAFT_108811 [Bipolaris victoriae FI3]|uniref:Uncharacterized protein n=1 Tax=Bipolaris victoriae (strain FI3) TaxID=930091 RepID=W7E8P6_BIPV3|nr:hypothetical protein COCVIDRAFT_108811 [Bipolaris victoriae FI3]